MIFDKWLIMLPKRQLSYAKDNLYTFNKTPFVASADFQKAYEAGRKTDKDRFLKGLDFEWRVHVHDWAAKQALHLEGDFLECGVRTGIFSTAIVTLHHEALSHRRFVLVDSFSGVNKDHLTALEYEREKPAQKENHIWQQVYQEVKSRWEQYENIEVIKGLIPEVLTDLRIDQLCYVSVDLNNAYPEKQLLEYIWPKLVPGGIIILDDYGYPGFEEQQQVHDAFAKGVGTSVLCLPTCQGIIIKPYKP